jgi:hypothetical protein
LIVEIKQNIKISTNICTAKFGIKRGDIIFAMNVTGTSK